ncbi:uncharacterized protein K452DRAFT_218042 [Aplosporella prunicola CBS 121167]|uniref:Arginine N-methyltransferase 2 n=1 Tax=Aplosporella prunicola CBS 121167 TaxID=1176127 RepID=A0A6A6BXU8_9PEZI|nr:uncharacterized protein K452DRAFT_218042 [Aplosporella prunicola CBS 121167]KAF2147561.1 hypothetical protein K452DRAFT_218042 [Aplosporella prunicola CBS 121167]
MDINTDLTTQSLLLAASNHDLPALRDLLRNTSANVQDSETGFTPLHAAIAACERDIDTNQQQAPIEQAAEDGQSKQRTADDDLAAAAATVRLLLQNGAIWNDLDAAGETPGCIAARLGLPELYGLIVDAGVRAELLLGRLDEYQILGGGEDSGSEEEDENEDEEVEKAEGEEDGFEVLEHDGAGEGESEDLAASGVVVEATEAADDAPANPDVQSAAYLSSELTFTGDRLLDSDKNGVMMAWETQLMRRSAELLLPQAGLRVLNVGHGMGIIDGIIQEHAPAAHHIIEAHPAVAARMRAEGWDKKPGVVVHEGRWQDVVDDLAAQGLVFDAIYFDTFAEEYKALRDFFTEHVIALLDAEGRFGFFNGLGADRKVCYDVYTKIVEMDLFEAGFDTEWEEIPIPDLDKDGEWEGVRRKYWVLDTYRLPTCKLIG